MKTNIAEQKKVDLKIITKFSIEQQKVKNYQHVALGILQRLNIHPEAMHLSTVLGSCTPRNNLIAVTEWIIEDEPNLELFGRGVIDEYESRLIDELESIFE